MFTPLENLGSKRYNAKLRGPLAQSVEHCTFNAVVVSSSLTRPTTFPHLLKSLRVSLAGARPFTRRDSVPW